jgi:hypothetical protein
MAVKYTWFPPKDQMAIKYTNIFQYKTLQNLPKLGILFLNYTIRQPCNSNEGEWYCMLLGAALLA